MSEQDEYYRRNKKRILAAQQRYRDKPEVAAAIKARNKALYAALTDEEKADRREVENAWRAAHPKRVEEYVRRRREKRRAARKAVTK